MAGKYSASVRRATNEVGGLWRGGGPGIPQSTTDTLIVELTEAQHAEIGSKGMNWPQGPSRFKWDGNAIVEQADGRRRLRFTPSTVDLDVGDSPVVVTVEVLLPGGGVDTGYNRPRKVVTLADRRLRLGFASGVATFTVRTAREHQLQIDALPEFRLEARLRIRVADTEIG